VLLIHPHALAHGVGEEDIRAAFGDTVDGVGVDDQDAPRWLNVGFDRAARLIEYVVVDLGDGGWLAIHAMPARSSTLARMRDAKEVNRWPPMGRRPTGA
jgi:hypothetical protein